MDCNAIASAPAGSRPRQGGGEAEGRRSGPPVALAVGGSDSCGGAGLQADLKTFQQWGVHGASAVTAVTAQNTSGVQRVHVLSPDMAAAQIRSVAADMAPAAVKIGMLASADVARAVAGELRESDFGPCVLDPVMVATSGDRLLPRDAVQVVRKELLPLAGLVTPNWPEAVALTGVADASETGMAEAARALVGAGAAAALVKGGHVPGTPVSDVLWDGKSLHVFRNPRVEGGGVHGTGCTLGAAATAGLALGMPLAEAVAEAVAWVHRAIAGAHAPGAGAGLLDFLQAGPAGPSKAAINSASKRASKGPARAPVSATSS